MALHGLYKIVKKCVLRIWKYYEDQNAESTVYFNFNQN